MINVIRHIQLNFGGENMSTKALEGALLSWLRVGTWYTSHPLDCARFHNALHDAFSKVGLRIDADDLEQAIKNVLAERHPGQERMTPEIESFVRRADVISSYLSDTRNA